MLLFICDRLLGNGKGKKVSIHLMLLFITNGKKNSRNGQQVSIHLMLLFIRLIEISTRELKSFNTSHVTLYPFVRFTKEYV